MTFKDVKGQNMKGVVFMNEQKKLGNSSEFLATMKTFQMMR